MASLVLVSRADGIGDYGLALVPNVGAVHPGLAGGLDLNFYKYGGLIHKIRMASADDLSGPIDSSNYHMELGYLIGKWSRNRAGYVSAMVGLSVVETNTQVKELVAPDCWLISCTGGVYEMHKSTTVGIPFHLEAILMYNVLGIGIALTGNFNLDASYGGVVLELPLGWVPF